MKQFVGRVNVVRFKTMSSLFSNHGIPFKIFTDKFPAIIKSFQWISKKSPEKRDKLKTTFGMEKSKHIDKVAKVAKLDKQYKSKYNTTFTKVIKKKLFPTNKGENKRKLALEIKKDIEYQMEEAPVER